MELPDTNCEGPREEGQPGGHGLFATTELLVSATTESETHADVVVALASLSGGDHCLLAVRRSGSFRPAASLAFGATESDEAVLDRVSDHLRRTLQSGKSTVVDDLSRREGTGSTGRVVEESGYRSLLCVPVGDWGVLVSLARDPSAFLEGERTAIERLGSLLAAVCESHDTEGLDGRVRERTEQVANVLSHDLGNVLSVADGFLDLARDEHESPHLDRVGTAHDRIATLTEDLVTFLRTGERVTDVEPTDLGAAAGNAWQTVDSGSARLVRPDGERIVADESQLYQLLENLFRNAVDHGGAETTVTVRTTGSDGFYVADDGPGVPASSRDRIFEPGYTTSEDGSGLGLAIVDRIASAHGWDVAVTESDAGGVRFEFANVEFA